jgi:hypothetical protein
MIPTLELLQEYQSRDLDQSLTAKLVAGLPNIRTGPTPRELCLQQNGVPRLDCGQFALGLDIGRNLMPELLGTALKELKERFGLEELKKCERFSGASFHSGHRDLREA